MEISTQKYSFVVEREVVRVHAEMLDNYALELWMESKGFRCRTDMADENVDQSWPPFTYPRIHFTPFSDPHAETVFAYVGDYLVFSGYGEVAVMKSADFNKAKAKLID